MIRLIRAALVIGGVGYFVKELIDRDKKQKSKKNEAKAKQEKAKPKTFFDDIKDSIKEEVDKVKDDIEKAFTPPVRKKTDPKANGKTNIKDIKVEPTKPNTKASSNGTTKSKPKTTAKPKASKAKPKSKVAEVDTATIIRYKVKDKAATVKRKVTRQLNDYIENAKSYSIGKTGDVSSVDMAGFKKLHLICVGSRASHIDSLAKYYSEKYAKDKKNKTESVGPKMKSKDGDYFLYILVK